MCSQYESTGLQEISQANVNFSFDLYKNLATEPGNLFFSPISIQIVLALLYIGAKGKTANQLAKGLHLPDDNEKIQDGFKTLLNELKDSHGVTLDIASKIYAQDGFPIKNEFKSSAEYLSAETEELDFVNETEQSRVTINRWVEKKTNDKIKDFIPDGVLSPMTRMVLANAVYFKGNWTIKFDERSTSSKPFHLSCKETKHVDTMFVKDHFEYLDIQELQAQAIALSYEGGQTGMIILLPRKVNGLADMEKKLSSGKLSEIMSKMRKTEVRVHIPKFILQYEKDLVPVLRKLGITSVFNNEADLSGISEHSEGLRVTNVLHKSFIDVNEEGTEAAAATGGVVSLTSSLENSPVVFNADHPFVFFIVHNHTKAILFAGTYAGPD